MVPPHAEQVEERLQVVVLNAVDAEHVLTEQGQRIQVKAVVTAHRPDALAQQLHCTRGQQCVSTRRMLPAGNTPRVYATLHTWSKRGVRRSVTVRTGIHLPALQAAVGSV